MPCGDGEQIHNESTVLNPAALASARRAALPSDDTDELERPRSHAGVGAIRQYDFAGRGGWDHSLHGDPGAVDPSGGADSALRSELRSLRPREPSADDRTQHEGVPRDRPFRLGQAEDVCVQEPRDRPLRVVV